MKKSTYVMMAAVLALTGGMSVQAENMTQLDTVYVTADRNNLQKDEYAGGLVGRSVDMGLMGRQDYMATPVQTLSISNKVIKSVNNSVNGFNQAITLDPNVRSRGGNAYNDIMIRGFAVSPYDFYIDGIPHLLMQSAVSTNFLERIDVISGPAALFNGGGMVTSGISGAVNIVPKRAGDKDIHQYNVIYTGKKNVEHSLDIGQRFGSDREWGIRISGAYGSGETFRDDETLNKTNIFVDVDYKTEKNRFNVFWGHSHIKEYAMDLPLRLGGHQLPEPMEGSMNFQSPWMNYKYRNYIAGASFERDLNDQLTVFVKGGYHDLDWYSCFDSYYPTLTDDKGNLKSFIEQSMLRYIKKSIYTGIKGNFEIGTTKHQFIAGMDYATFIRGFGDWLAAENISFSGNLYDGSIKKFKEPTIDKIDYSTAAPKRARGYSFIDKMEAGPWIVLAGLRYQQEETVGSYKASVTTPSLGVAYKITPKISVFGNWLKSMIPGSRVSTKKEDGYVNAGEDLKPTVGTQHEIGVKWDTGKIGGTASIFNMSKQAAYADENKVFGYHGAQESTGFQVNAFGTLGDNLHLLGGFAYMTTQYIGGSKNGKEFFGQPHWNATLALQYDVTSEFTLTGRMMYNSDSWANSGNTTKIPGWTRVDVGGNYKFGTEDHPITLSMMVFNVFGKKYWYSQGTDDAVYLGMPRTVSASLSYNF